MKSLGKYLLSPAQCWALGTAARDGLRFAVQSERLGGQAETRGPRGGGGFHSHNSWWWFPSRPPPLLIHGKVLGNISSLLFVTKDGVSSGHDTPSSLLMPTLRWGGGSGQLPEDRVPLWPQGEGGTCTG